MLNDIVLFNLLKLLINLFLKCHTFLLSHFFLNFSNVLLCSSANLLRILFQLFFVTLHTLVGINFLYMLNKLCTISDHCTFEGINDWATPFVETVRAADLYRRSLITVNTY